MTIVPNLTDICAEHLLLCNKNNSSHRLHGIEQYNYGNMKVNERIADVKLPRNL